jgi:cation/acetate symporter
MLVVYYAFIMTRAFSPELVGQTIGYQTAIFPYKYPALFSVSVAFLSIYFISITDNTNSAQAERDAFEAQDIRSQTGIGAEGASNH